MRTSSTTRPTGRGRPQRLARADLAMLWPDDAGWPSDVGLIAVLDGRELVDADGRLPIDELRRHLVERLAPLPRFRQVLVRPPIWQGLPYWLDTPTLDPAAHIDVVPVRPPADDSALLRTCEQLRRRPFDPDRPRWAFWFLTDLPDGKVALYARVHHSMVDGMSGIAALATVLDLGPVAERPAPPPAAPPPASVPSTADLLLDVARRTVEAIGRLPTRLRHPRRELEGVRAGAALWRRTIGIAPAPRTSVNHRVGRGRRLAIVHSDLDAFRRAAHTEGATVNDVLLAAVAGGLRGLLVARGEEVDELVLRAMVPVSLHGHRQGPAQGNADGGILVDLPVGETDPARRLRRVAADTAAQKQEEIIAPMAVPILGSSLVVRTALRLADRQRMSNVYVVDLPGLGVPAWFAGAPVLAMHPVVPLSGNLALGVAALSYAGRLDLTVVADEDAFPDLDVFVRALDRSIAELVEPPSGAPEDRRP
jgi:diacylglycerol O-acyltransferase / wax synthase